MSLTITQSTFIAQGDVKTQHLEQLSNIGDNTVSTDQWTILGLANQDISSTGNPSFTAITATGEILLPEQLVTKEYVDNLALGVNWQTPTIDKDLTTAPGAPSTNDRYIIAGIGGGWAAGTINDIAEWNGAAWVFTTPTSNYSTLVTDESASYLFNGASWIKFSGGLGDHEQLSNLDGGILTEHYHLNLSQHTSYINLGTQIDQLKSTGIPTFAGINITGTGTVDGVDVSILNATISALPTDLSNLTNTEISQLENIGATTIGIANWTNLGLLNQDVGISKNVQFGNVLTITPSTDFHAATKKYVDDFVRGVAWLPPVEDKDLTTPPVGPTTGDRYIVATTGTGAWIGESTNIAEWNGAAWVFTTVTTNNAVFIVDEGRQYIFNGTVWVDFGTPSSHNSLSGIDGPGSTHVTATEKAFFTNAGANISLLGPSSSPSFVSVNITGPSITNNASVITLPTSTSILVGHSTTNTLTNKTMGDNLAMGGNKITGLGEPTASTDASTKNYVDTKLSIINIKDSVKVATIINLDSNASISGTITYTSMDGASGRGQITATLAVSNVFTIDGISMSASENGSRILLKNQTSLDQNGIWVIAISGTSLTLDRSTDFDNDIEVSTGAFTFISEGTINENSGFALSTIDPIIIGGFSGSNIVFTQFTGAGQITAGTGMTNSGNIIDVIGSSTIISNADNVEVNSSSTANQILLSSGSVGTSATFGAIPLGDSNSVSGQLSVASGGTGTSTHSTGNFLQGNGTSAIITTKAVPTGDVVGTSDTQTLTSKTLTSPIISSISNTGTITVPTATTTLVGTDTTDILSNKTLTLPQINDTSSDHQYIVGVSELAADRTTTLPLLTGNDTFVFESHAQTLTNKTLIIPIISAISNVGTITFPTATTTLVGTDTTDTLSNKTLVSPMISSFSINDTSSDHQYIFGVSELVADRTTTLPLLTGNDTFVFESHIQTLANKTLTSPVISTISNTGTITIPTATTTLVGNDTTDTLTNKTISGGSITSGFGDIDIGTNNINAGRLILASSTGPVEAIERNASNGTSCWTTQKLKVTTTADMDNTGFGIQQQWAVEDNTSGELTLGYQCCVTDGAKNSGKFEYYAYNAGVATKMVEFKSSGINMSTGKELSINGTSVLDTTTLGLGVINSSLTSFGVMSSPVFTTPQINDTSSDHQYIFGVSELAADRTTTLPLLAGNDTFVFEAHTQTLANKTLTSPVISAISNTGTITLPTATTTLVGRDTTDTLVNKTLTSPIISTISNTGTITLPTATTTLVGTDTTNILSNKTLTLPQINDTSSDHQYIFGVSELVADRTTTLPLLTGNDTFVFEAHTQTLANKTLTSPIISTISNTGTITLPTATTTLVGRDTTDTLANKTLTSPIISTISNTGTITLPTATTTLVGTDTTDILSNKTLTLPQINDTSSDHQYIFGVNELAANRTTTLPLLTGNDTFVFEAHTQTLANKTLTSPIISTISNTGTITLPTATTTLVGRDTTDTLANKTLTSPIISTISNTGTITLPTATTTLVGTDTTNTLSNKTWGDNLDMNSNKIIGLSDPSSAGDAANKSYVDLKSGGANSKRSVNVATTVGLNSNASISGVATYNSTGGASGRGQITATLTVADIFTIDAISLGSANNDTRILLKDQTSGIENGIYTTTILGTSLTLDRSTDLDSDIEGTSSLFFFVDTGSDNGDHGYLLSTNDPIVIGGLGGTTLSFARFTGNSGSGAIITGTGMTLTGSTINVIGSATMIANANNIEINSSSIANQILLSSGTVGVASTFGSIPLGNSSSVSGQLTVSNGGTGASTFSSSTFLQGNGTSAISAVKTVPDGVVVGTTDSQILSNKTLTLPQVNDTSSDHQYIFGVSELAADRTITLPLLTGNDTFIFEAHTQTLTNKTLTSPIISTISNTGTITIPTATTTLVGTDTTDTLTNKTLTSPIISTISNTGTITIPTATTTLVGTDTTDTLSNKTLTLPQINDTSSDHQYIFGVNELVADRTVTLPLLTTDDSFVFEAHIQTLTNKTLTSPIISTISNTGTITLPTATTTLVGKDTADILSNKTLTLPQVNDTSSDHQYIFGVSELSANRTTTLPLLTGNDTFVFEAHTQTLSNKTLTSPIISTISNTGTITLPTATTTLVGRDTTDTLTNKTITSPIISSISNTGTITLPTATTTLVGKDTIDILSNKTLTLPQINDTSSDHQYIFGVSELVADRTTTLPLLTGNDTFVFEAHTQTLANKTLTSPIISTISNTGTITLPTATTTLVGRDTTDTLTNKTLSGGSITSGFGDIDIGSNNITAGILTLSSPAGPVETIERTMVTGSHCWTTQKLKAKTSADMDNTGFGIQQQWTVEDDTSGELILGYQCCVTDGAKNSGKFVYYAYDAGTATKMVEFKPSGINLLTGKELSINGTSVLDTTTLGTGVINSSLTSFGIMSSPVFTTPQINDTSLDHQYIFGVSELAADRTTTLPLLTGNDTFVFEAHIQTLTNKTLTSPVISTISNTGTITLPTATTTLVGRDTTDILSNKTLTLPQINDTSSDHQYIVAVGELIADRTVTLPLLIGNDTFVFESHIQTLTNKTLTTPIISVISNTGTITIPTATTTLVGTNTTDILSNKTLTLPQINDTSSNNQYIFAVGELIANRTVTLPLLAGNDTFVFNDHIQTLTNKTLTSPVISAITNIGTLTLPTNTTTIVGKDTIDILTNKTMGDNLSMGTFDITNGGTATFTTFSGALSGNAATATTAGTVTTAAQPNITSIGTLTVLDVDNININGNIISASSDVDININPGATSNLSISRPIEMNSNKILGLALPTLDSDAASKAYVDSVANGLDVKRSVVASSETDLDSNASITGTITYTATGGTSARGQITATLTVSNIFTLDGHDFGSAEDGTRVLIKEQTSGAQNGIWITTILGTSLTLDRATDFDKDSEVTSGAFTFVEKGNHCVNCGYVLITSDPIIIGGGSGTVLVFGKFSGTGEITAGSGLTKTGDAINAIGSDTIIANVNDIEINSSSISDQILLSSGSVGVASTFGALPLGNANSVSGQLTVSNGGTGVATFTSGNFLQGNGTSAVTASKVIPAGVVVGTTDSQTLTNKTLTTPIISIISNTGTITLPTSSDTLVGRSTTDILTNKTLAGVIMTGDIAMGTNSITNVTSVIASNLTGTIQTSAQTNITSLGTLTSIDIDNININNNTISTTNVDGDFIIAPNGTGDIHAQRDIILGSTGDGMDIYFGPKADLMRLDRIGTNLLYDVPTGGHHCLRVNNVIEYEFDAAQADFKTNNIITTGNITGLLATAAQTNITSLGTLTSATVGGNLTVNNTGSFLVDSTNISQIQRDVVAQTTSGWTTLQLTAKTAADMSDGFGPSIQFNATDSTATNTVFAEIDGVRDGADNTGQLLFKPCIGGTKTLITEINQNGINIVSGKDYFINDVSVLNATTLGSSVISSSLTTLGPQAETLDMNSNNIENIETLSAGTLSLSSTSGPVETIERVTGSGNACWTTQKLKTKTNVDMNNTGYGIQQQWTVEDDTSGEIILGYQCCTTDGAENTGRFSYTIYNAGVAEMDSIVFDTSGMSVATGNSYQVNGVDIINATTIGTSVVNTSITSTGILASGSIASGFGDITGITNISGTNLNITGTTTFGITPTAPTAALNTNSTVLATTEYVHLNSIGYEMVDSGTEFSTSSTTATALTGMTLTPPAGKYIADFHGDCVIDDATFLRTFDTAILSTDLDTLYAQLIAIPSTGTHGLIYSNETVTPGVYDVTGAMTGNGNIILDGLGQVNPLFIIKASTSLDLTAVNVTLTNGAKPENVFWIAQGVLNVITSSIIHGTMIAFAGAIVVSGNPSTVINGRLLALTGALTFTGQISAPTTVSPYVDMLGLYDFVMFTKAGAVTNTGLTNTYTGSVATQVGAVTGFATATFISGGAYLPGITLATTNINHSATYSIYNNNVLVSNSARTVYNSSIISLKCVVTVVAGQSVDVRLNMSNEPSDNGTIKIVNRILTLTKVGF
jgi:hypothetical protein